MHVGTRSQAVPDEAGLRRRILGGFAAATVLLLAVGAVSYWSSLEASRAAEQRKVAYDIRRSYLGLLAAIQDAEAGQRGWLLTSDSAYLAQFELAADSVHRAASTVRWLTLADSATRESGVRVVRLSRARLDQLRRTLGLRLERGVAAAVASVRAGQGRALMDSLRRDVSQAAALLNRRIEHAHERTHRGGRNARYAVMLGTLVAVLLISIAHRRIGVSLSQRVSAEAAVKASEGRLFRILESLPVAVFVVDAAGRPYYANRLSSEILGSGIRPGVSVRELPQVYSAYVAGTDVPYPPERQPIAHALQNRSAYVDDIEIRRPERHVPIEVWASPVHDADGGLEYAVAAFQDITTRREAERRIREAQQAVVDLNRELDLSLAELREANRDLEAFSYSVSHDLRSPLRAIDGFSRALLEDHSTTLDDEARRLLGIICDSARRMGRLIDDLLRFSRIGRSAPRIGEVDMNTLVNQVIENLRQDTGVPGPDEVALGQLPPARGDATLLAQVWANLIGNAVKYSRSAACPKIEITAAIENGVPVYAVRDNGVGFDMARAGKLFSAFERLHSPDEFEGSGLGLAIVRRIVERHGGRVWAESAPGHGATFSFTLEAAGGAR